MNSLLGILLWTFVGALVGWGASAVVNKGKPKPAGGYRRTTSIMVGIGGALLSGALTRGFFGSESDDRIGVNLMVALLGSTAALAIVALFRHPKADAL